LLVRRPSLRERFGWLTGAFLIGYAVCRIIAECFRQPDAFLGYIAGVLTMGQILSFPMLIAGVGLIWYARRAGAPAPRTGAPRGEELDEQRAHQQGG